MSTANQDIKTLIVPRLKKKHIEQLGGRLAPFFSDGNGPDLLQQLCTQPSNGNWPDTKNKGTDRPMICPDPAYEPNGTDQEIEWGDDTALNFGDATDDYACSFSYWMKVSTAINNPIISKTFGANAEWSIHNQATGVLTMFFYDSSTSVGIRAGIDLSAFEGQWVFVVFTYDGSGAETGIDAYVFDNQLVDITPSVNQVEFGVYTAMHGTAGTLVESFRNTALSFYGDIPTWDMRIHNRCSPCWP